ncbi:hypothetical protein GCM10009550_71620 [Actinocorallia libanotica]|uniref:Uncharacterized protein n=1 Tax=Actinocorallia libanotica TaxID=46162 RepID=A0ABN1RY21_9ACTN
MPRCGGEGIGHSRRHLGQGSSFRARPQDEINSIGSPDRPPFDGAALGGLPFPFPPVIASAEQVAGGEGQDRENGRIFQELFGDRSQPWPARVGTGDVMTPHPQGRGSAGEIGERDPGEDSVRGGAMASA